jgi:hypothetical protein
MVRVEGLGFSLLSQTEGGHCCVYQPPLAYKHGNQSMIGEL